MAKQAEATLFPDDERPKGKPTKTKTKEPAREKAPKAATKKGELVVHSGQVPAAPRSLMEAVMIASTNPLVDTAKMKELLSIRADEERKIHEREFNRALFQAQADMRPVYAESWNDHTKSRWARYEAISRAIDPIIRKHSLVLTFGMGNSPMPDHYRVTCDVSLVGLTNDEGFTKGYFLDGPSDASGPKGGGTKSAVQGVTSTITYLRRVLKCLIFDVKVAGEDVDGNDPGATIDEVQAKELRQRIENGGPGEARFLAFFKVEKLEALPANRFNDALVKIDNFKAGRAGKR